MPIMDARVADNAMPGEKRLLWLLSSRKLYRCASRYATANTIPYDMLQYRPTSYHKVYLKLGVHYEIFGPG